MPLNPAKIALAVQQGYSVYCATCTKLWEGKDKGLSGCTAKACGGPPGGNTFPEYDGPITNHAAQCFACGGRTAYVALVGNRDFGVCSGHLHLLQDTAPVKTENGALIAPGDLLKPKRKSLFAAIMEVEEYYAKKAGII